MSVVKPLRSIYITHTLCQISLYLSILFIIKLVLTNQCWQNFQVQYPFTISRNNFQVQFPDTISRHNLHEQNLSCVYYQSTHNILIKDILIIPCLDVVSFYLYNHKFYLWINSKDVNYRKTIERHIKTIFRTPKKQHYFIIIHVKRATWHFIRL